MNEVTIFVAFFAGLGSFFAPCILPMVPAFLAYISGTTISDLTQSNQSSKIFISTSCKPLLCSSPSRLAI